MDMLKNLLQSFIKHLRTLLDLTSEKSEDDVNEILIKQANSEEEKRVFREICEDIDLEHRLMQELENSGIDSGEWLERKIESEVKELIPDATAEDIERVKEEVANNMEEEIKQDAEEFEKEISDIQSLVKSSPNKQNNEEE